ncbi:hypothetical protein [Anaerosporobacter sp.]
MHLIKRYVEDVLIHVTFSKRKKVKEDVLKRIEEVALKQGNKSVEGMSEDEVMKVLDEIGNPRELGRSYCKSNGKIVGKESAASYQRVLCLSLIYVIVGNVIAFLCMDTSNGSEVGAWYVLKSLIISLVFLCGFITLIYFIANKILRKEEEKEEHSRGKWTALHLRYPQIKRPNKRMDYIIGLFVKVVLLILVYVAGNRLSLGVIVKDGGEIQRIPLFLASRIQDFKVLITIMLLVSTGYSIAAIWRNRPSFSLLIWKGISGILNAIGCFFLFRFPGIWNTEFVNQMQSTGNTTLAWQSISMQNITSFSMAFIMFVIAIDIMHAFYRFFSNI